MCGDGNPASANKSIQNFARPCPIACFLAILAHIRRLSGLHALFEVRLRKSGGYEVLRECTTPLTLICPNCHAEIRQGSNSAVTVRRSWRPRRLGRSDHRLQLQSGYQNTLRRWMANARRSPRCSPTSKARPSSGRTSIPSRRARLSTRR